MTDRTVPTEPTWEMQIAGRDAILSEDDTLDISTDDARAAYIAMLAASPPAPAAEPVAFTYRNWRGEVSERHVRIIGIRFGSTEWHPEPQLLLRAFDLDKGEEREFAVNDIGAHPIDAAAIRAEARHVDEVAREELRARAALLIAKAGWKSGDKLHLMGVVGNMVEFAAEVLMDPPARCNYPGCGCDHDARCAATLADKGEAEGWRPIETAPHDGTHVQVCDVRQPSMPPFTAHWFGPPPLPGLRAGNWYLSVNRNGDDADHGCRSLTHWRPLPAPPAGGRDGT